MPAFIGKLVQRAVAHRPAAAASDMVQAIEPAELPKGDSDGPDSGLWLGCIRRQAAGRFAERLPGFLYVLRIAARNHGACSVFQKGAGGGKAQARCAANDNERFAFELAGSHFRLTLLRSPLQGKQNDKLR